ncbi:MAG: hypothetical protein PHV74_06705 [Dehalococcoidia bacterium]|nr:hypothetical protein [Dehalococcoidia bacterium]
MGILRSAWYVILNLWIIVLAWYDVIRGKRSVLWKKVERMQSKPLG